MTQPQMPIPQARPAAPQLGTPRPAAMPTPRPMPSPQAMPMPQAMPGAQSVATRPVPAPHPHVMPQTQAVPQNYQQAPQHMAPALPAHPMPGQMAPTAHPQGVQHQGAQPHMMPDQMPMQAAPSMPVMAAAPLTAMDIEQAEEATAREGGERALPQISIHAFCDRPETAQCISTTQNDWRMKRTNLKVYMGGLRAAIDFYHKENTPSLIVIESGMRGQELFSQLEELASVCDEGTKVVMIGATNDIRLYRQLMDQGVSDYIVPPLHPLQIIRSFGELYSDPDAPFVGRVVAFFGASGGVGSSTLAHNTAWCLAEMQGQETALIDMDASWGTTGLDFAYDNTVGLEEALAEPDRLDETLLDRIMIRHTPKLSLLPTAGSLNQKPVMDPAAYEMIVNAVRSISPLSILDMPHYWADWTTNILSSVDDVVITATADLANLRNAKNLFDFLKAQRPNDPDPIFILNKTDMSKTSQISTKNFVSTVGLDPAITIGFDPDSFFEASNDGKMLSDVKTAAQTVSDLQYVATRLRTGRYAAPRADAGGKKSLLSKGPKAPKEKSDGAANKSMFSFLKKKG